ncbi:tyrosine-type recombinase/integrase [Vibrio parahaemolyticus]|nr:tyrosine-type recombinase/integrase [Vibrio parahaemolyticus]EIE1260881.1 tyrosine-type recombinase/integrase [Vibrio parahaemolyticus]EIE1338637.1 tyrosine-type recombinase/integrase [Vibrio parahaemolyticus]EJC6882259.1 tyrosine-type recombinase/integrase [Vibrio parahaemolyticus]EJC6896713.1 tyrosine-type recombinase/integrase [Vibrio parahaemolyticus]
MKSIKFSNDNILQLAKSNEALEQIPLLLKKRYGNQMADIWAFGVITGLRIVDKLNIRFENISGDKLTIKLGEKGKKTHEVALSSEAQKIIRSIKNKHPKSKYLFQSHARGVGINKPITARSVHIAFKEVGESLSISLAPHMMRHIYAMRFFKSFSPSELAGTLSHSSVASTIYYLGRGGKGFHSLPHN